MDPKRYYKRWVRAAIELCGGPAVQTLILKKGNVGYEVFPVGRDVEVYKKVKGKTWFSHSPCWNWLQDRRWKSCDPEDKKLMGELAYQKILEMLPEKVREEIVREAATQALEKPIGRVGEVSWSREKKYRARPFFDTVDEILPEEVRGSIEGIREVSLLGDSM